MCVLAPLSGRDRTHAVEDGLLKVPFYVSPDFLASRIQGKFTLQDRRQVTNSGAIL